MMRRLDEKVLVAGQIDPAGLGDIAAQGITTLINNRPDFEEPGQPTSAEIEAAARAAGLDYRHIPVSGGFSHGQVEAMTEALESADGQLLAFCKSGTRSAYLWALAEAARGTDGEELLRKGAAAGYDLSPMRGFFAR
ncbi:MAG TPA: TIGR01244 family sulfur transferase [Allosphingosinicella sp.]|jgi:uncharacterized protein (TIGR01244 family)